MPCEYVGHASLRTTNLEGTTTGNKTADHLSTLIDAPVVFFCENNAWAISMPRERQTASDSIAVKAEAYGFEGVQVDGNDPLAVRETVTEALADAREGDPVLTWGQVALGAFFVGLALLQPWVKRRFGRLFVAFETGRLRFKTRQFHAAREVPAGRLQRLEVEPSKLRLVLEDGSTHRIAYPKARPVTARLVDEAVRWAAAHEVTVHRWGRELDQEPP